MEPDEIQKLYPTSITTTQDDFYKVVSWSDNSGVRHNTYVRPDGKLDLSSVSTRDLLNECYRRRAIEKFSVSRSVDSYMFQQYPDIMNYVMRDISKDVLDQVVANKKFYEDALVVNQTRTRYPGQSTDFEAEIYICKHPTKVKR